jgi:GT2 family glycosyltransferase
MGFLACAVVVRTAAFLAQGGFDDRLLIGGEEEILATDLVTRAWDIVYVDDLVVHHYPSSTRSADLRRRHGIRNTLWFLWLRRPLRSVLRRMSHLARTLQRDRVTALALADALRGLPWILRERRVVPPEVERELALLDEPQMTSEARRHVS